MASLPKWLSPLLFVAILLAVSVEAQTTQGLISGGVIDSQDGRPVTGARVTYENLTTDVSGAAETDASGLYVLSLLSPGTYRLRVTADRYQPRQIEELELPVAAFLDLPFRLRPLDDVWEQGQYRSVFLPGSQTIVTFYGPDVDTSRSGSFEPARAARGGLESTISDVIDPAAVRNLPLAGRDVYTALAMQPGVTSDAGTVRSLGLAANGQRPSASNFLLDGLENNNYLVTGPLVTAAPEVVQEYRVSTNNFSAEYGRTSGFVANAVTRSGGSRWHGIGYFYLKNDALNANDFQNNFNQLPRTPVKEDQSGFQAGGPLQAQSLFVSGAFEHLRFRSRNEPADVRLPTTAFSPPADSLAHQLLQQYPAPPLTAGGDPSAVVTIASPSTLSRDLALPRVDYISPGGRQRLMGRVALSRVSRPDFIWSPYKGFTTPLNDNTLSVGTSWISSWRPDLTNEARLGWSSDDLRFDRAHPEIPTLQSGDGTVLPGSPAFYGYRNRSRSWELLDNLVWVRGGHVFKLGGGALLRRLDGYLTAGRDGFYAFANLDAFSAGQPFLFLGAVSRAEGTALASAQYDREYRYNQFFAFAQDSYKATPRLVLNYGVRYENFGAPRNTGAVKDVAIRLGPGSSLPERLVSSSLLFPAPGDQQLYASDNNNWAVRAGFSYNLRSDGRTLLRGSYGIFYDRPFDNLWQNLRNNNFTLGQAAGLPAQTNYLAPIGSVLASLPNLDLSRDFPRLTLYQPGLRDAYVQSYFAGVEHLLTSAVSVEINATGSLGRKLITTDIVNRDLSVPLDAAHFLENPKGRFNPSLPLISYRSNQGLSNYNALTLTARYRGRRKQFQLAYTWSHTIDNQSEPLAGDFFDLSFTQAAFSGVQGVSAFTRQFDSRLDRGNSDFDQRHNLVFFSIWEIPALWQSSQVAPLLRGWNFSQLAAIRSGFPYNVTANPAVSINGEFLINNRVDVVDPALIAAGQAAPGGKLILNSAAFEQPAFGTLGNLGRNALIGPGFYNVDLSLSRSFALPWLGEAGRLTFRADAFNIFNHANLNNPDSRLASQDFGVALYGRQGRSTGFPAVAPFAESARQIQLLFRVEF